MTSFTQIERLRKKWREEYPKLSVRARNLLARNGIESLEQLASLTFEDVMNWRKCGELTVREYHKLLTGKGLDFAKESRRTFGQSTYTNDVQRDFDALMERLRSCDGISSDAVIITWEAALTILEGVRRLREGNVAG